MRFYNRIPCTGSTDRGRDATSGEGDSDGHDVIRLREYFYGATTSHEDTLTDRRECLADILHHKSFLRKTFCEHLPNSLRSIIL